MIKHLLFLFSVLIISLSVQAQAFEIRAVNEGFGTISVQVRETSDVPITQSVFITDIRFGIKWNMSYGVDLADVFSTSYNIRKLGTRTQKDSFYFQAFYADNTPYQLPEEWPQDTWVELLSISNTLEGADTGTFRICETGFDATTNPDISINLVDFTPAVNGEANGVVLPLSLLSFSATPVTNAVRLSWATVSEINCRGFGVERSEGSAGRFISLSFIDSKGGSGTNSYLFTDRTAIGGVHYYYRLRQTDNNGSYHLSDVKDALPEKVSVNPVQVFPNPATNFIRVQFGSNCQAKPVTISLSDSKGNITGIRKEMMEAGKIVQVPVAALAAGHYYLLVTGENGVIAKVGFEKM